MKSSAIMHRKASDIEVKDVNWLWPYRFARGKISIIAGNPGIGKSQITAYMAGNITNGRDWPDGTECDKRRVLILNAEDDPSDTIVPRLVAAGADLDLVHIIDSVAHHDVNGKRTVKQFDITKDIDILGTLLSSISNVSAIFIDPITAYLGNTDDHKNSQVRAALTPLSNLAEEHNVAIICVSHNNKNVSQEALMRIIGSVGFVAASRSAFIVIKDEVDDSKRLFLPLKNNNGNDKTGLSFNIENIVIENGVETSRVAWLNETVTKTADEVMQAHIGPEDRSSLNEAEDFLRSTLSKCSMHATEIIELVKDELFSEKTLIRAKSNLGVKSKRIGFGKGSSSYWHLPIDTQDIYT